MHETAIIGEAVAGESAKVRVQLDEAIKLTSSSVFDVMDLLYKVKKNKFYVAYGFPTMQEFYEYSLNMKPRKCQYLLRVAEVMEAVHVQRTDYEPLGISKLREITRLNPEATYTNPPMADWIHGLIFDCGQESLDKIQEHVRTLMGKVGENDKTWLNLPFTRLVMKETIRPAIEKMKAELGTTAKTAEGLAIDASDSYAVEMICADKLAEGEHEQ
jgi:hypothetical protein